MTTGERPPRAADQTGPLEVGRVYEVDCVRSANPKGGDLWLPIFGTVHADDEVAGAFGEDAGKPHFHLDHRFLTDAEYEALGRRGLNQAIEVSYPVRLPRGGKGLEPGRYLPLGGGRTGYFSLTSRAELRPCLRDWPPFPGRRCPEFERRYEGVRIDPARPVCPHQGFDLSGVRPAPRCGRSVRTCPGHGLSWCADTGRLVRTTQDQET